jgi:hypothetical protein
MLAAERSGSDASGGENRGVSPSYQYIESRGTNAEFMDGMFERMVQARREAWFGSDASGLIRSTGIGWSFYTDEQRARWKEAPARAAREDLSPAIELYAPGCLSVRAQLLKTLPAEVDKLAASLAASRRLSVHRIGELMGEALVPPALRRPLYEVAAGLPGAEVLASATDMLGRSGLGGARLEGGLRKELIFDPDSLELLARRMIVVDPARGGIHPGATVGSTCYLARELVHALPEGIPPIPGPPCSPSGAGTGILIEPGFTISTGYFTDLAARLEEWHAQGVITDAQYQSLKDRGPESAF